MRFAGKPISMIKATSASLWRRFEFIDAENDFSAIHRSFYNARWFTSRHRLGDTEEGNLFSNKSMMLAEIFEFGAIWDFAVFATFPALPSRWGKMAAIHLLGVLFLKKDKHLNLYKC